MIIPSKNSIYKGLIHVESVFPMKTSMGSSMAMAIDLAIAGWARAGPGPGRVADAGDAQCHLVAGWVGLHHEVSGFLSDYTSDYHHENHYLSFVVSTLIINNDQ